MTFSNNRQQFSVRVPGAPTGPDRRASSVSASSLRSHPFPSLATFPYAPIGRDTRGRQGHIRPILDLSAVYHERDSETQYFPSPSARVTVSGTGSHRFAADDIDEPTSANAWGPIRFDPLRPLLRGKPLSALQIPAQPGRRKNQDEVAGEPRYNNPLSLHYNE